MEVRELLDAGTPVNHYNSFWKTALHQAIMHNQVASARLLVERGAELDSGLLHWAGGDEMAAFLLEQGLDIEARDDEGRSALYNAIARGRAKTAEFLIQHGQRDIVDKDGKHHALEYAAARCHFDAVRVVFENKLEFPRGEWIYLGRDCEREMQQLFDDVGLKP